MPPPARAPPRRVVMLPQKQLRTMAFSVDDQEAALAEWRSKAQSDKAVFNNITSKITHQKRSAEQVSRFGRWLAERAALDREAVSCEFEFEKAWASCASFLPEAVVNERASSEERYDMLHSSLTGIITGLRKDYDGLCQLDPSARSKKVVTLLEKLSTARDEFSESTKVIEHQVESLLNEVEDDEQDSPVETIRVLVRSSLAVLEGVCTSVANRPNSTLVRTYREAIEAEGEKALSRLASPEHREDAVEVSVSDARKISLVLRTYSGLLALEGGKYDLPGDVYSRVQQSLPGASRDGVRVAVNEVLRRKREKELARTTLLHFKKRSLELLKSFEKAVVADEEICKLLASAEEEAKLREEQQIKRHEELNELRAIREAKELARREEEGAKRREEEEKKQKVLRLREMEFQERLKQLRRYQEQQKELQQKEAAHQKALAEEEAAKRAIQAERDAIRIAERRKEYEEMCRLRRRRQEEIEGLRVAREKTLEAFFDGVRERLGVEADPERVLQGTVSSKQGEAFVSFAEAARYTVHGYTADEIARDPRFRLQLALFEAGLHKTAYGREVISRGYRLSAAQRPSEDNPLSNNF